MANDNKIDAKEVLLYLNQLGYTNINAQTLKDFLTDLKKLIKSSTKHVHYSDLFFNDYSPIRSETLRTSPTKRFESHNCKAQELPKPLETIVQQNKQDVPSKRIRHISLHLMRNVNKASHKHCIHVDENSDCDNKSKSKSVSDPPTLESASKVTIPTSKSSSKLSSARQHGGASKPVNRRDPVALYHYYQSEWKKVKFPGEEEHAILRRTVRKKLNDQNFKKS